MSNSRCNFGTSCHQSPHQHCRHGCSANSASISALESTAERTCTSWACMQGTLFKLPLPSQSLPTLIQYNPYSNTGKFVASPHTLGEQLKRYQTDARHHSTYPALCAHQMNAEATQPPQLRRHALNVNIFLGLTAAANQGAGAQDGQPQAAGPKPSVSACSSTNPEDD